MMPFDIVKKIEVVFHFQRMEVVFHFQKKIILTSLKKIIGVVFQ